MTKLKENLLKIHIHLTCKWAHTFLQIGCEEVIPQPNLKESSVHIFKFLNSVKLHVPSDHSI
jgi:hypothetical protein